MVRIDQSGREKKGRRGSVLLLAIAVLVLLVVIGTAFVTVARTERTSTRAMVDVVNLDRARETLLGNVVQAIGATGLDADGRPLTMATPWEAGVNYAVGDIVYLVPNGDVANSAAWGTYRCMTAHVAADAGANGPPTVGGKWTTDGAYLTARRFDYPEVGSPFGMAAQPGNGFATVPSRDEPWLVQTGDAAHFARLTEKRYSPLTGGYDAAMPAGPEVAVTDGMGAADGAYDILPFTTGSGLRYRVSFRVEDESGRANLNVGNPDLLASGTPGRYLTGYSLFGPDICVDNLMLARNIHGGISGNIWGRAPGQLMDFASWQATVLRFEQPCMASTDPPVALFDLTDEMELRANGVRGAGNIVRASEATSPTFMANTLGAGARTRAFFTTQSVSRDFTGFAATHAGYTVGDAAVLNYPRKVCFNIPTPLTATGAANAAAVASNLAWTMEMCGYNVMEARSLAINYVAYKVGSGDFSAPSKGYWLPNGPSFLDGQGIKVRMRTGMADFSGSSNLHPDQAGSAYIGLSAQPFINEVVARVDPAKGSSPVDYAVELANPYPFAIDLAGTAGDAGSAWQLEIRDENQNVMGTVSLAKATGGKIAAGGYYVVTLGPDLLNETTGAAKHRDAAMKLPAKGFVVLKRPVKLTAASAQFDGATIVDMFGWHNNLYGAGASDVTNYSLQRDNKDPWMCAINFFNSAESGPCGVIAGDDAAGTAAGGVYPGHTLGQKNVVNAYYYQAGTNPLVTFKFYDRAPNAVDAFGEPYVADGDNSLFDIADFNRIPRVANMQLGNSATVLSQKLEILKDWDFDPTGVGNTYWDGKVRFDFLSHADPSQMDDPRAVGVFENLSLVDRFADTGYSHMEPNDPQGRFRTRVPGRINLNTAPVGVLKAVPGIVQTPGLAEMIVAYRDRTGIFAGSAYPGMGIRSQAELFVPLSAALAAQGLSLSTNSLEERDRIWSGLLVNTTVRSDTFVVYGVVEALSAGADHDNSDVEWYDAGNAHQTVVARRRFLALVDRSFQNYAPWENGSGVPRVLAMKDLGQ